jgi:hypothetical protein
MGIMETQKHFLWTTPKTNISLYYWILRSISGSKYTSIFAGKYVRHSAAECATTGPGIKPSDWHISTLKSVDSLNSQQYPFKGLKRHKKKIGRSLKQPVYTFYSEFSIFFAIH